MIPSCVLYASLNVCAVERVWILTETQQRGVIYTVQEHSKASLSSASKDEVGGASFSGAQL